MTGTSSGIGRAITDLLSREGFAVFASVRNQADARSVEALGAGVHSLVLDVTDHTSVRDAARVVAQSGMPLSGVVSNAGIAIGGPVEYVALERLRMQLEVNVVGAVGVAQAFLPQLRVHHGRLIFIGSIAGRIAMPFIAPYSASKFALRALADALRIELGHAGVFVSLIEPGSVKTPIWRKGRETKFYLEETLGRVGASHYGEALARLMQQTEREEESGMPPQRVARAVLRALISRRPRAHDVIGAPARIGTILRWLLPSSLHDRMMRRSMGI